MSRCLGPKLSLFKFSSAFEILATPQGLLGAAKVSDFNIHACKLDTCLMKGYIISSIL